MQPNKRDRPNKPNNCLLTRGGIFRHPARRLRWRAIRFKLPFGFSRQDKVALSQTLNLVRPDLDLALSPGQKYIRMMALSLRDRPNLFRKR